MRVLVTGGGGFVGKHVIKELQSEYELFTPSSRELNLLDDFCMDTESALSRLLAYLVDNKIEAIIHLAGNVGGIGYNQNHQAKLGYDNLQMGLNVLEAARLAKVKKLVILGTTCSYPSTPKTIPFIEEELFDGMPEITNSGYGIVKRTLIKLAIEYTQQYGMDITNLIPTNMFGEFDHFEEEKSHVIPALIKKFESRNPQIVLWGDGSASRDFLYVTDCAKAIKIALGRHTGPEPINLGTGKEIQIKELVEMIKSVGQYESSINWDTSKPNGQLRRSLNIDRAQNLLNWEPTTPMEKGLLSTINWYRKNEQ